MKFNSYQKTAITTVAATLFLILVGGLVRSTGAGMGCPDWPKCFGQWIPPTSESELPEDYQTIFVEQRIEKNTKIVGYLNSLGFNDLADTIKNDPKVKNPEEFNAIKTWTEYVNRLVGAVIGLLVFATFITSLKYWKTNKSIPIVSAVAVLLTGFQGWLGSVVVSTNLLPGTISIHMVFALVIVNVLLYGAFKATSDFVKVDFDKAVRKKLYWATLALLFLTTVQMVMGTQVREAIDLIKSTLDRSEWIENTGTIFLVHRSFSWLIALSGGYLFSIIYKNEIRGIIYKLGLTNLVLIVLQIGVGIALEIFNVPPAFQVIHLVAVALMICAQFLLVLILRLRTE
ncbi:MAG: COX15/CtaA family protein [Balneolaceae bacterium]